MTDHHADPFKGTAQPSTLVELLRLRARSRPDEELYTFWSDEGAETFSLTYGEVDRRARAVATWLRSHGAANDRALLLYPPGLEFVAAFFGCLYAGVVPVPAYPPRLNRNLLRVQAIIADAQARFALTTAPILARVEKITAHVSDPGGMCWLDTGRVPEGIEATWQPPRVSGESLAFLQYTSGSTGAPKGAMLSHSNLLHNASLIYRTLSHAPGDKYVSWLPTFHDMGFMAGVLQPLYGGLPVTLISPPSFLRSPVRWLQAITGTKATTSGAPNFAYDLCVRKTTPKQRAALDLSSWTTAFNGAEPVRAETLERFIRTFEPCGFRPEVMYPCYGLAEATLIVSGGRKSDPPVVKRVRAAALESHQVVEAGPADEDAREVVGCGSPLPEQRVVIVNPETMCGCPAGEVGEIWVAGPSVARGYWRLPEESAQTFQARLADTGEGPFLRTGDLGFLQDEELFVTGRLKDLIIIRGANHYPQDIELTVERSHSALRPGCGAVFSVELDGEERLVAVQEVERKAAAGLPAVVETIRQAVSEVHDLHVHSVVLIKPGSIPKTSSGKIQRRACRAAFLAGSLDALERSVQGTAAGAAHAYGLTREALSAAPPHTRRALLERYLQEQVASALRVEPSEIKAESPANTLGLDSLTSIGLQGCVETDLGVSVSMVSFLQEASLSALAGEILRLFEGQPGPAAPPAAPRDATSEYALSYGQRALWYLHQLAPESAAYNISRAVRLRTRLDIAGLRRALQKLLDRHASLRATFHERQGEALQHVQESAELFMREEDASSWGADELHGRLVEEANRPFDLERGPLFRVHLFARPDGEHVLLLSVHHIVADFWSLAVLMHELGTLNQAEAGDPAQKLSSPSLDYADYVRWQDAMLAGPEGERHRDYWQTELAGELPPLNLPVDHPRPPVQTYRGSSESLRLDAELSRRLKELGGARGSTLYVVLLAAFQVLLHRYTGQKELTVGSPAAGRGHAGFSEVVGYFVNPLVLRADLTGDPTFEDFLGQVGRRVLGALEHQDYPFPLLVEQLQPARDPSRTPLFQAMFVLQKTHLTEEKLAAFALGEAGASMELGALTLESLELKQRVAQFDLTLMAAEVEGGLAVTLEYNSDLFEAVTIRRMLAHYRNLLEAVAVEPRRTVAELPLLTAREQHQLLYEWNETAMEVPGETCIHHLFEAQAARTPDAVAVLDSERGLTYSELDGRAELLSRRLRALGVGPERLVAILLDRSVDMLVALLATFKAGGAYLPLDPVYPRERLSFMLEDAAVSVLLTQRSLLAHLPGHGAHVLCLDANDAEAEEAAASFDRDGPGNVEGRGDAGRLTPRNLAYVIYTSGSTGRPKGVAIEHRSAVTLLHWARALHSAEELTGVLASTSLCFDLSIYELFLPLCVGGCVILAANALELAALPAAGRVTLVNTVPSAMAELVRSGALPPSVRTVNLAGEALSGQLARQVYEQAGVERLYNLYGPSEDTTYSTCALVRHGAGVPPIGRPVANTQLYLLDGRLAPVPAGASGGLYLGGDGLARGYLGRPALTAERFIPDPFSQKPGARLYYTGDLARYLPDGEVEYLGRLDHQVKIRGYRIELGEIEAALLEQEGVRQAAAVAREEGAHKRLVAYVVAEDGTEVSGAELRESLKRRLPGYMVPSAFVFLDELPLTANGKLDRRALAALAASGGGEATGGGWSGEWGSEAERELAGLWREALGVSEVGPDDNFFDLGGDSILTLQIISRARQAGFSLTPRQFLQHQTVAQLAAVAQRLGDARFEQEVVTGPTPLTPIQHWFFEQDLTNPHHWNQAVLLELKQELSPPLLEEAIRQLLTHHDALRLRFERTGAGWRQFNAAAGATAPLTCRDLSGLSAEQQEAAVEDAAAQAQTGLNISTGPLMRAVLFQLGEARPARLLLVIHHLAIDGVSWRILLEDIQTAFQQLGRGEAVSLPRKTSSYKRWAESLAEYARGAELEQELAYWLAVPHASGRALPSDFARGPNTEESAGSLSIAFSPEETRALLKEVPSVYHAQVNDVLLLALAQAFSRWTGEESLLIDLKGHGREELFEGVDVSRTVGWFTAVFPVLLRADATSSSPGEALKAMRERLRRTPRRGVGYGALRYLRGDAEVAERLRALPQAEVSFNYLGQVDQVFAESALFEGMREGVGPARDPKGPRRYLLDVEGRIVGGRLRLDWRYSRNFHRTATIEKLAEEFAAALRAILTRSGAEEVGAYTVSDFPLARLEPQQFAQLAAAHGRVEDIYPLSPIQQGMLFHSLYTPESGVYVEQLRCSLRGELNAEAFERAWRQAVERHPALRTCFVWSDLEEPLQVVRREVDLRVERRDWRELPAAELGGRLRDFLRDDRARGFDLGAPPLMRLTLFQTDAGAHEFVLSFHHLLLDGWSLSALWREVFAAYGAAGRRELKGEPARPYVNYIDWLRRQDLAAAEGFWREFLEGFAAPTTLAVDQSPGEPSGPRGEYAERQLRLSADTTAALQSFARGHRLTLNTLLQGAWSVLLSRYSGEEDVVFGMTVSGRPADLPGVEAMVGLFINTLPIRARVSAEATPLELLRGLQLAQAEVQRYEYSPLVQVQGWSAVPRHLPLFESILVVENFPVAPSLSEGARGLRIDRVHFYGQTNYPLTVQAAPGRELLLQVTYDSGRFEAEAVGRMLGHYLSLLEAIIAAPRLRLSELNMLTPAERERLLVEWNDTGADFPPPQPIHRLFEAQAERRADEVALVFDERRITYGELNRRANHLARRLREFGVGPEVVVGLLMERSVEMVVGLLGVLKAGGAYLPLDPSNPSERISFMLEDSKVGLLLTQKHLLEGLPPGGPEVMSLDSEWPLLAGHATSNLDTRVTPDNLAYVIYTSGSTGRPKGAMNTHRAIYNRLLWMQEEYKLSGDDRVLQKTPFSFDVSVWEFFWPLLYGAQLVLARPGGHQDSAYLVSLIKERQITTLHFVPSMLQVFLEDPGVEDCRSLRRVICSGEALPASLQRRFFERLDCELHNLYGPTEAAVDVTYWACCRDDARTTVPIGRPIANIEIYLLDSRLAPVPVGVSGELHIGGVGLARGYLSRPGLTAEKFVPNPFGREPGARLYRTGDLARFLPDGQIEFLGRLDQQIKLRGFRIELGEIEAALAEHPSVEQCVLHALTDAAGEKRLVAYFVSAAGRESTPGELRTYLKGRLPEYMIPGAFVPLAAMPLMSNGKVDRRRLPAPSTAETRPGEGSALPRTDSEKALARLWGEVLGHEPIGLHDNFFDLGGHSLSALRIVTRLRGSFGLDLSPRALFEHPTVAELARLLDLPESAPRGDGDGAGTSGSGAGQITPQARRDHLPLSFAQQRFWYLDRLQPGLALYNCAAAVRLEGRLDVTALTAALREIVRRHEVLRTVFPATDEGLPVQVVLPGLAPEMPVVSLQDLAPPQREGEAERLMREEARAPFDLSRGPLFRFRLLRLDEQEHVLMFAAHHIIVDGWSMGVLVGELAALYEAALSHKPWPLPDLPIQFADYALWQRQRLSGAFLEEQFDYWRRVLAGAPTQLKLPSSRPRPAAPSHGGGRQVFVLPRDLSEALDDLSRREGVTLFMTLLAAFKTLLYRHTGQENILVGTAVANRRHEQAEGLIGCFINTLVLRTDLSGSPNFRELLRRTRDTTLEAFDHQELPFEKLVERLHPERSLSHTPLVQVVFGMQNAPMPPLELPGLTLTLRQTEEVVARLDLTLWIEESPEGLKASWTYATDLFDPSEIARMHGHFLTLLSSIAAHPQTQIDDLEMLTEAEKEQEALRKRSLREESYKRLLKVKPKSVQGPLRK